MSLSIRPDPQFQPMDAATAILWDQNDRSYRTFYVSGWDGYIRCYLIEGNSSKKLIQKWDKYLNFPVICMDILGDIIVFGLATGHVGFMNVNNGNVQLAGEHNGMVCKVFWVAKFQVFVSFGYDTSMKIFSLQTNQTNNNNQNNNYQTLQYKLPSKTVTAAFDFPYFLIGSQDGRVALLNIEKLGNQNNPNGYIQSLYENPYESHHGHLKYSCCCINTEKRRIVLGTSDGRIITINWNQTNSLETRLTKPYLTRCQKKTGSSRRQLVGQMNCLSFGLKESKYQFVLYCGSQQCGVFNIQKNAKTKTIGPSSSTPVTAISISPDCENYAYAVGYDWSQGIQQLVIVSTRINVGRLTLSDISSSSMGYTSYTGR